MKIVKMEENSKDGKNYYQENREYIRTTVFRTFIRVRSNKYKMQFPKMGQTYKINKIISQWKSMTEQQKFSIMKEFKARNLILPQEENDKSQQVIQISEMNESTDHIIHNQKQLVSANHISIQQEQNQLIQAIDGIFDSMCQQQSTMSVIDINDEQTNPFARAQELAIHKSLDRLLSNQELDLTSTQWTSALAEESVEFITQQQNIQIQTPKQTQIINLDQYQQTINLDQYQQTNTTQTSKINSNCQQTQKLKTANSHIKDYESFCRGELIRLKNQYPFIEDSLLMQLIDAIWKQEQLKQNSEFTKDKSDFGQVCFRKFHKKQGMSDKQIKSKWMKLSHDSRLLWSQKNKKISNYREHIPQFQLMKE